MADTIATCQNQLEKEQYCSLPGFFPTATLGKVVTEVDSLIPKANQANSLRNCYLERTQDPELPHSHPRNIMNPACYRMIPADLFSDRSSLKKLYFWDPFRNFISQILGEFELYPRADPLQPVNVICYGPGDQSAWHYDSDNAFTMTLMPAVCLNSRPIPAVGSKRKTLSMFRVYYRENAIAYTPFRARRVS